jgi:hypothetical protein
MEFWQQTETRNSCPNQIDQGTPIRGMTFSYTKWKGAVVLMGAHVSRMKVFIPCQMCPNKRKPRNWEYLCTRYEYRLYTHYPKSEIIRHRATPLAMA